MRTVLLKVPGVTRHGWLPCYAPLESESLRVLDRLAMKGWIFRETLDGVYRLEMPDPVCDPLAVTQFLPADELDRLLSADPRRFGWVEVFPSPEEARTGKARDGRAFVSPKGSYLIIDLVSGQVSRRASTLDRGWVE